VKQIDFLAKDRTVMFGSVAIPILGRPRTAVAMPSPHNSLSPRDEPFIAYCFICYFVSLSLIFD